MTITSRCKGQSPGYQRQLTDMMKLTAFELNWEFLHVFNAFGCKAGQDGTVVLIPRVHMSRMSVSCSPPINGSEYDCCNR